MDFQRRIPQQIDHCWNSVWKTNLRRRVGWSAGMILIDGIEDSGNESG
jgi:hypothetical protein